jgi:hypothetical protein
VACIDRRRIFDATLKMHVTVGVRELLEVIRILPIATGAVLARRQATKLLRAVVDRATKVRYGLAHVSFFIVLRRAPQVRLLPAHFYFKKAPEKKRKRGPE